MAVGQNQWDPILGVGEFTTRFRLYFSGDWDVRDFDPQLSSCLPGVPGWLSAIFLAKACEGLGA